MTMSEIIFDYMPPKPVTDRLIARFFRGKEPAWCMYHPVFYATELADRDGSGTGRISRPYTPSRR